MGSGLWAPRCTPLTALCTASPPCCGANGPCSPGVSRSIQCRLLIAEPGTGTCSPQGSENQILQPQPVLCAPVTPPGPSPGSACSGGAQNSLCWRRGPVSRVGAGSCDTIAIAGAPDLHQEAQS